jgi:hypothetical protein
MHCEYVNELHSCRGGKAWMRNSSFQMGSGDVLAIGLLASWLVGGMEA